MDKVLEAMIGATLLFGKEDLTGRNGYAVNPEIREMEKKSQRWYEQYKSPRRERQIFELLKTQKGQEYARRKLNMHLEFSAPMLERDIVFEYKWALTLLLAKYGIVPKWQSVLMFINDSVEYSYASYQRKFLQESGCDVEVLDYVLKNVYYTGPRNSKEYYKNKGIARDRREKKELKSWIIEAASNDTEPNSWYFDHVEDDAQIEVSELSEKFLYQFGKNSIKRFFTDTWRRDETQFFSQWITAFALAEQGKIPSWQVDWSPEYKSDYLCFIEQIRILKQFGHDPWPLLQQLPAEPPTKYRTLEDVLFEK